MDQHRGNQPPKDLQNSSFENQLQVSRDKQQLIESTTQNQISQFIVQSTEVFSTKNDGQLHEDASKEETSLFDKQLLYDRSLLDNPSQDMQHFISQEDALNNQIEETLSEENQDSVAEGVGSSQVLKNDRVSNNQAEDGRNNYQILQNDDQTYFNSTLSSRKNKFGSGLDAQQRLMDQSPYQESNVQVYTQKKQKSKPRQPLPMKKTTIDRIIYPVYTKRGIKYGKKRAISSEQKLQQIVLDQMPEKMGKLLDGFLILYSCRVKLPHESIKSKLASQKIVEVIEEDLCYFQNLNSIDLSDNRVRLEQLKNLKALSEINLQYNMIQSVPPLSFDDFPKLENLNLSYNQISPASIRNLYSLRKLKVLDLQGNSLVTLPDDLFEFQVLEELNLSSNLFSSISTIVNPSVLFKALGQLPRLKRLNLSRNKFSAIHNEYLAKNLDFTLLQEIDFSYNIVQDQEDLQYATQLKSLQILVITGNPFALQGKQYFQSLEEALQKNLSASVINDEVQDQKKYLKKKTQAKQNFPYPNPIKLFSRELQKEIKGDYLNAELMNQGVALQIAEIRPNTNIEKEIFPRELTRDAQEKEIFTPPNHKQMRFLNGGESKPSSCSQQDQQFFITENILQDQQLPPEFQTQYPIQEERSQESENSEMQQEEETDEKEFEDEEEDENFDFGRAKMDYFKQRAKEILLEEDEYEGTPIQLTMCYKNLKNALRNPVVVHNTGSDQKPGYLKMTFSMCRQAVNGDRFLELSKLQQQASKISTTDSKSSYLPPLMRAGKDSYYQQYNNQVDDAMGMKSLIHNHNSTNSNTQTKKKSKREEQIDKRIEYLLDTYKKQDQEANKRAQEKEQCKNMSNKMLRDKFGFSDNEDDEEEK